MTEQPTIEKIKEPCHVANSMPESSRLANGGKWSEFKIEPVYQQKPVEENNQ